MPLAITSTKGWIRRLGRNWVRLHKLVYVVGVLAVLMTGANADGAEGCATVRRAGGTVVVQDPDTAQVPMMPAAALELAGADYCLPLPEISLLLESLCS